MNYTSNSSRAPNTQQSTLTGFSGDIGIAPATIGQLSDSVSFINEIYDGATLNPLGRAAPENEGIR